MPSAHPSLRLFSLYRLAALVFSFLDTLLNLVVAVHILALWYSFRWEAESSDWEWLADKWRALGVWILFSYFSAVAAISAVGLAGIVKNKPSLVHLYRDYYIADLALCASFFTLVISTAFQTSARTFICEEFPRHPELVKDVQEIGIGVENCELWLSRTALGLAAFLFAVIIVRLHVLFAISSYYSGLSHCSRTCYISHYRGDRLIHHSRQCSYSDVERIFVLPVSPEDAAEDIELVLVPVLVNKSSHDVRSKAKEAWLSGTVPVPSATQHGDKIAWKHHDSRWHSCTRFAGINDNTNPVFLLMHEEGFLPVDRDCINVEEGVR